MKSYIRMALGLLGLLASTACTPNAANFLQTTGYDAEGVRTGSFLPVPGTLTPF